MIRIADGNADAHGLADSIVYGPVESRRYGRSLGINLLPPGEKTCGYDCVYCQFGHSREAPSQGGFASVANVKKAILGSDAANVRTLVLSGNGEATLHPQFAAAVEAVREARDARFPGLPIVCLTSGSELHRPEIVRALRRVDECAIKLDAGRCETLRRIALPRAPACVEWLVSEIRRLGGAVVQTCFFDGVFTNADDEEVWAWIAAVHTARPRRVDLYTVSRTPALAGIQPVRPERLNEIGERLRRVTGLDASVFATG